MKDIYNQLSKREQTLLYVLMIFLVVMIGWFFLIVPALDQSNALKATYQDQLSVNGTKTMELLSYQSAASELALKKDELLKVIEDYNDYLDSEIIEKTVTGVIQAHNLRTLSLQVGLVENAKVIKGDETSEVANVSQVTLTGSAIGTSDQIRDCMNTFVKMDGIEVVSMSYSQNERGLTVSYTLNFYMTSI